MIELVISGFQTGADIGGIRAAHVAGIPTGGWMPLGWKTEEGPRPEYAGMYGAKEHPSPLYPPRTEANARDTDGTIWFGNGDSRGFGCTMNACRKHRRPTLVIATRRITPADAAGWIRSNRLARLNVAGNRESSSPGIGERVEVFMDEVFRLLRAEP